MVAARNLVRCHHAARQYGDVRLCTTRTDQAQARRAGIHTAYVAARLTAPRSAVLPWLKRRVVTPLISLLKQGISPQSLAMSVAFGIGIGIFPVLGISTVLLTLLALGLRLNMPAIQLVNYLMYPLQLLLIIPFVRLGEQVLGAAPQPISIAGVRALIEHGLGLAIRQLSAALIHATIGWLVIGPALIYLLFRVLKATFSALAARLDR